jgi:hypothetical protein
MLHLEPRLKTHGIKGIVCGAGGKQGKKTNFFSVSLHSQSFVGVRTFVLANLEV